MQSIKEKSAKPDPKPDPLLDFVKQQLERIEALRRWRVYGGGATHGEVSESAED